MYVAEANLYGKVLVDDAEDEEELGGLEEVRKQLEGVCTKAHRELGSKGRLRHLISLQLFWQG